VGVLASFLGDPVARAKAGAPLSVTLKLLRSKGVKVYCRRVPKGHEDLSTPQRSLASHQGATPAEERARAATAATEMDGGTPCTPATPVATLFGKTPPASKQGLPNVAEVVEEAEVVREMGAEDTLPVPDHTPRAQKRAGELAKQKKKTEKGKEPEQNSSDDEPPDDSGGDGDDVGDVEDGEGARLQKPSGDERRAGRSRRPKASKNEGAGRGRDKDRGKGKEQKQGKKPSKSGEQKKKLLKKLKKLKERTKKKEGGGDDDDDDSSSGDGGSSSSGDEDDESDDDATENSDSEGSLRDSSDFDSDSGGSDEDTGHRRGGKSGGKVESGWKNLDLRTLDLRTLQRKVLKGERLARLDQGRLTAIVGSPSSGFDVQCDMDGLKLSDKNHTLHEQHAAWESYTATRSIKKVQRRLERSSPGHKRLDKNPDALDDLFKDDDTLALASGTSFTMTSNMKTVPEQARFQRYVLYRKRELQMISKARPGALKKSRPNHQYHHEAWNRLWLLLGTFGVWV